MKDLLAGIAVVLIILGVCYGLNVIRPQLPPTPSQPFSLGTGAASSPNDKIVMRVNGEPIGEVEFNALVQTAPEEMRGFYGTDKGRRALAEQLVRLKTLQQEARRLGAAQDPGVTSQIDVDTANIMAQYALRKLVGTPSEADVRGEYEKSKESFSSVGLSHILVAYQGGQVPPRNGQPLPPAVAMQKAKAMVARLRSGGNFEAMASNESDDVESGRRGGDLGAVTQDMLPPELADAVMRLQPGQVSDPVVTHFGVHILRVSPRKVQPFEQVRNQIAQKLQQQRVTAAVDRLQKTAKVDLDPKFFGATTLHERPSPARRPS